MRAPWRASSSFSTCRCSGSVPECRKRPSKSPRRIILRGLFAYRVVVISRYGSVAVCGRISGFRGDRFCICEKRINFEDGGGHPRPLNRNPMATKDQSEFKYLVANDRDRLWGITVTSVGFQRIDADEAYPPGPYTHLRAHETDSYLVCRLLLEKKKGRPRKERTERWSEGLGGSKKKKQD